MNKKLLLSAVIFTISANLMPMQQDTNQQSTNQPGNNPQDTNLQCTTTTSTTIHDLPKDVLLIIVGCLSDDTKSILKLSLVSKVWEDYTRNARFAIIFHTHGRDARPVDLLNIAVLKDYKAAVCRYANLYKIRQQLGCTRLQQNEFNSLQDFIIKALINEMIKTSDQVDFCNYVYIPLRFNINFHNIPALKEKFTPLHVASLRGHLPAVQELIRAGADLNKPNINRSTSLHLASCNGHLLVVMELIRAKADVNKPDTNGETPLHIASLRGHLPAVQELIRAGADLNKPNINRSTSLHLASCNGHLLVVMELIRAGADLNKPDIHGRTPLHVASFNGHLPIVQELIRAGADLNKPDIEGGAPLHLASYNGHLPAVQELIRAKADLNKPDNNGFTPLHEASLQGHLPVVQELLAAGANLDAITNDKIEEEFRGKTALQFAQQKGFVEIVQAIQEEAARREETTRKSKKRSLDQSCGDATGENPEPEVKRQKN